MDMFRCPKCGKIINARNRFCTNCGLDLSTVEFSSGSLEGKQDKESVSSSIQKQIMNYCPVGHFVEDQTKKFCTQHGKKLIYPPEEILAGIKAQNPELLMENNEEQSNLQHAKSGSQDNLVYNSKHTKKASGSDSLFPEKVDNQIDIFSEEQAISNQKRTVENNLVEDEPSYTSNSSEQKIEETEESKNNASKSEDLKNEKSENESSAANKQTEPNSRHTDIKKLLLIIFSLPVLLLVSSELLGETTILKDLFFNSMNNYEDEAVLVQTESTPDIFLINVPEDSPEPAYYVNDPESSVEPISDNVLLGDGPYVHLGSLVPYDTLETQLEAIDNIYDNDESIISTQQYNLCSYSKDRDVMIAIVDALQYYFPDNSRRFVLDMIYYVLRGGNNIYNRYELISYNSLKPFTQYMVLAAFFRLNLRCPDNRYVIDVEYTSEYLEEILLDMLSAKRYELLGYYQETPIRTRDSIPPIAVYTPSPTARSYNAIPKTTKAPDYSWHLQFTGINTNENDNYTNSDNLRVGDCVYFHAHLTGGAPNEKILLYYEICMNDEFIESSAFSDSFSDNSDIWVRNSPFRYGTLSIRVFYYANNGNGQEIELGSTSVHIDAREDNTQTEISKGWIRSADVYFNRYNNLCFDLTNNNAENKAIIWFTRNENSSNTTQSTVVGGQVIWDSPVPGVIYQYAIWVGDYSVSQDVASLGSSQIPSSAWIKLYVTEDKQVVIVSSDVAINIKENEQ